MQNLWNSFSCYDKCLPFYVGKFINNVDDLTGLTISGKNLKGTEIIVLQSKLKFESLITWWQKCLNFFKPRQNLVTMFLKYWKYVWTVAYREFLKKNWVCNPISLAYWIWGQDIVWYKYAGHSLLIWNLGTLCKIPGNAWNA